MENKKEQSTASSLLRFAGPYKGKYILSIFLSVLGVASGLVPYYAAAQMLIGLIGDEREFSFYLMWGAVAAIGYIAKSCFSILSTSVSHTATFHALRGRSRWAVRSRCFMRPRPMAGMWWAAAKSTPRLNATWNLQNKSRKITKMLQNLQKRSCKTGTKELQYGYRKR